MPSRRPRALTAAAIMCIIYGALGSVGGVFGFVFLAFEGVLLNFGDPAAVAINKRMAEIMENEVPGYRAYQIGHMTLGLILSVCLLMAGIGLLKSKSSSRKLAMVTSLVAAVVTILGAIYTAVFVIPAILKGFKEMDKLFQNGPGPPPPPQLLEIMEVSAKIGAWIGVAYALAVAIFLVVIFLLLQRSEVREAIARGPADLDKRPREVDDRERRDDDNYRRDFDSGYDDEPGRDAPRPDDRFRS